ncbi:uncharacterized protein LOC117152301 [Bombus impatiens]|uniref:Uncharacterized protein LOC117152301 n=1 Tax=Bombus impatiens TaxID=132113 RepID=A0A6P8LC14_BOMIM|nr:uncharacterized protein LOC117152301 [Bombus impatiens]
MTLFPSNLYKSENCTLTVYKSKPNVKVLLLRTKHTGIQVEDNHKRVPETIAFYNKTKFAINAWILCKECTGWKISRKEFIFCQRSNAPFLPLSTSEVRKSCQVDHCKKNRSNILQLLYILQKDRTRKMHKQNSVYL